MTLKSSISRHQNTDKLQSCPVCHQVGPKIPASHRKKVPKMGKAALAFGFTFCLLLSSIQSKVVSGKRLVTEKFGKSPHGLRHDDPVVSLCLCGVGNLVPEKPDIVTGIFIIKFFYLVLRASFDLSSENIFGFRHIPVDVLSTPPHPPVSLYAPPRFLHYTPAFV